MPTAEQIVKQMNEELLDSIDEQLDKVEKQLRKYQPLIEQRDKLKAARRALLNERAPAQGGGRGLSQAEVVNALTDAGPSTVHELAQKLSVTEAVVRGHLNRGKDERFKKNQDGTWELRDPEQDEQDEEDDE